MKRIFISYRRSDSRSVTGRIVDRLKSKLPFTKIFKDVDSIPAGVNFVEYTNENLKETDLFIPIIGNTWASSLLSRKDDPNDYVRIELEEALKVGIPILPVFVENTKCPTPNDVPDTIANICHLNGINVRPDPDFESDVNKLITKIKSDIKANSGVVDKILYKLSGLNLKIFGGIVIGVLVSLLLLKFNKSEESVASTELKCDNHKIANILANFDGDGTTSLSNTTLTYLENILPDSIFTQRTVEKEERNVDRYHESIAKKYFSKSCDTIGLFTNGYINKNDKSFNVYATNVGLVLQHPDFITENNIGFVAPDTLGFVIKDNAEFLADLIATFLKYYYEDSDQFIKSTYQIQQKYNLTTKSEKTKNGKSPLGYIYLMRADHYARQGNEKRAQQFYSEASKIGNKNVQSIATQNKSQAQVIADVMWNDPELRKLRAANLATHANIESEFAKFIRVFEEKVKNFFNKLGIR